MVVCGVLLDRMAIREDTNVFVLGPHVGQYALFFPQGGGRVRAYLCYQHDAPRLSGEPAFSRFVEGCVVTGALPDFCSEVTLAGPLATFDGADNWVDHPIATELRSLETPHHQRSDLGPGHEPGAARCARAHRLSEGR